jgi:hypothetical protein
MDTSTFDPTRAVVFDLARGQVALESGGALLLMPADVVATACAQLDPNVVRQLGTALGRQSGARVRTRLAHAAAATLEQIVEQLGGEISLGGFGSLTIERWGRALVARIDGYPLGGHGQELLGGYIEGALQTSVEREVTALPLERTAQSLRFLLCNKGVASKVKGWLLAGNSWGDALAGLHGAPSHGPRGDAAGGRV